MKNSPGHSSAVPLVASPARTDAVIADLAAIQHGVVTFSQLRANGIGRGAIEARVRAGRLHRVHRGVYAVGHAVFNSKARWMAAVLACGDGTVLSHASAAALWELLDWSEGPIDVSVLTDGGRARR